MFGKSRGLFTGEGSFEQVPNQGIPTRVSHRVMIIDLSERRGHVSGEMELSKQRHKKKTMKNEAAPRNTEYGHQRLIILRKGCENYGVVEWTQQRSPGDDSTLLRNWSPLLFLSDKKCHSPNVCLVGLPRRPHPTILLLWASYHMCNLRPRPLLS